MLGLTMQTPAPIPHDTWINDLSGEDIAFIRRFVLASGSLKKIAAEYGVSYPTVRRRLDRLISKIEVLGDRSIASPFERRLRAAHAEGRIDAATASELLDAYREEEKTT
jgi:hypothetical protein